MCPLLLFGARRLNERSNASLTVAAMAERVAAARGLELVEVQLPGGSRGGDLRVFVDRPGGVAIDDLQAVSVELSALLDASDPIAGRYRLEVSSPGLDRPLRSASDFTRHAGQWVQVQVGGQQGAQRDVRGRIVSADGDLVTVDVPEEKAPVQLPISRITHARIEIEIPRGRPRGRKDTRTRKAHG
jgi:ribosome maturation factor RimP